MNPVSGFNVNGSDRAYGSVLSPKETQFIAAVNSDSKNLFALYQQMIDPSKDGPEIVGWLQRYPSVAHRLERARLDGGCLASEHVTILGKACPNLKYLSMLSSQISGHDLYHCLSAFPNLEILDLCDCQVEDNSIPFHSLQKLKSLDISSCKKVTNEIFMNGFWPNSLTELLIDDTNLNIRNIQHLSRLTLLQVSINEVDELCSFLNRCDSLKELHVFNYNDDDISAEVLDLISYYIDKRILTDLVRLEVNFQVVKLPEQAKQHNFNLSGLAVGHDAMANFLEDAFSVAPRVAKPLKVVTGSVDDLDRVYEIDGRQFLKIEIAPDGSCLFNSLITSGIYSDSERTLRATITQYLRDNQDEYQALLGPEERQSIVEIAKMEGSQEILSVMEAFADQWDEYAQEIFEIYVDKLENTKMFGGFLEIKAAANYFNKSICIQSVDLNGHPEGEPQVVHPGDADNQSPSIFLLRQLDHYNALVSLD